tara:strand:- start:4 stop:837 length:834 start_codon:yes stop_codon:yes gene_type:complete
MKKIYLSSSDKHIDDFFSFHLKEELQIIGFEVINPSRNEYIHSQEINQTHDFLINKCDLFISILKSNYPWQMFELGYAIASGKKVLIVADTDTDLPYNLKNYQFIRTDLESSHSVYSIIRYLEKIQFEESHEERNIETLEEFTDLLRVDSTAIDKISGSEFELLIANFFKSKGYGVQLAETSSYYGFDLMIDNFEGHRKTIIEIKKYNRNSKVSINTIHQVFGTMSICEADYAIVITTSDFTSSAKNFATSISDKIELWNYETLIDKIRTTHNKVKK